MRNLFLIVSILFYESAYGCVEPKVEIDCSLKPSPKSGGNLENYHHSKLAVIAINNATATILAPDGKVYSVEKGTRVGTHDGVVVKFEKDAVIIDELVSTGMDGNCGGEGSWVKRSVKLKVRA